ncbi:MAG: glycosyltransferase family 39 protein [Planctomycetota bacterium]
MSRVMRNRSLPNHVRRGIAWVAPMLLWVAPMLLFVILRFPTLTHQPGMQDEQWFAVPGLTVMREGIPRIPYLPTRRRETFFENADVCLMALPPGLFYVQAPFFALFDPGYPTARLPLFIGGIIAIGFTQMVTQRLFCADRTMATIASVTAGTWLALSRPLLFTGLTARPDLLCIVCGWVAVLLLWKSWPNDSLRDSAAIGIFCGLGGLFHPFALVFGLQTGGATLCKCTPWPRRLAHAAVLALSTIAILALWLPLVVSFHSEFQSQFYANVLNRAGPGLASRLVQPFPSIAHHAKLLWEFAGPWQCGLMCFGLVAGTVSIWRRIGSAERYRGELIGLIALGWSSVYLTATVAGLHPTKGYWIYSFFWTIPMAVLALSDIATGIRSRWSINANRDRIAYVFLCSAATVLMLPQSGLRTTWLYMSRWRDPGLHAPTFIESVLEEIPQEGVFYADLSYVFDVYLSGRHTRLCQERRQFWGEDELEYAYLILSWEGDDAAWASQYEGQFERRFGDRQIAQHCFVDLYQSREAHTSAHLSSTAGSSP